MIAESLTGPFYDPPYDSPIEDLFALNIVKYLADDTTLDKQNEVATICGTYRLDFVIERRGWRIGVECDGRKFHDEERDKWRDALIFGAGAIDEIYRLAGSGLTRNVELLIHTIARHNPAFFSERGLKNIRKLTFHDEVSDEYIDQEQDFIDDPPKPVNSQITMQRLRALFPRHWLRNAPLGEQAEWWSYWRAAKRLASQCKNLAELIRADGALQADIEAKRVIINDSCEDCEINQGRNYPIWEGRLVCKSCYEKLFRSRNHI